MNYKRLLPNLRYCGLVRSIKRDYHVLEGPDHYLVLSPGDDERGNYTLVPKKALRFITKKLGGTKAIDSAEVYDACKGSQYFPSRFAVLNAMYALIGAKGARISKIQGQKLFFNIWKEGA